MADGIVSELVNNGKFEITLPWQDITRIRISHIRTKNGPTLILNINDDINVNVAGLINNETSYSIIKPQLISAFKRFARCPIESSEMAYLSVVDTKEIIQPDHKSS